MNRHLVLITTLAAYLAIASLNVRWPLIREHETGLMDWGQFARSIVRFGWVRTGFAPLAINAQDLHEYPDWRSRHYANRPVLGHLTLAAVFELFGEGELQMRATLMAMGLMSILAMYLLAGELGGPAMARVATPLFALTPFFTYYSIVVYHFAFVMPFSLLGIYFYCRWYRCGGRRRFAWCALCIFLACQCDWVGYYATLLLSIHTYSTRRELRTRALLAIVAAEAIFCLHLLHMWLLEPETGANVWSIVDKLSMILPTGTNEVLDPWIWTKSEGKKLLHYGTFVLVALATLGFGSALRRRTPADLLILLLPLLALDEILYPSLASMLKFWLFMITPALALMATRAILLLWNHRGFFRYVGVVSVPAFVCIGLSTTHRLLVTLDPIVAYSSLLGRLVRQETAPHQNVLLAVRGNSRMLGYYADRRLTYSFRRSDPPVQVLTESQEKQLDLQMIESIRSNAPGFDVAVAARKESFLAEPVFKEFFATASPERLHVWLDFFQIDEGRDPVVATLEKLSIRQWDAGPFRFYRLR